MLLWVLWKIQCLHYRTVGLNTHVWTVSQKTVKKNYLARVFRMWKLFEFLLEFCTGWTQVWLLFSFSVAWSAHVLTSSSRTWRSGRTTCCPQDSLGKTASNEYFGCFAIIFMSPNWFIDMLSVMSIFSVALKSIKLWKVSFVVNSELWVFVRGVKCAPTPENWTVSVWCMMCLAWDSFSGFCQQCYCAPIYQSRMYEWMLMWAHPLP